MKKSTSSAFLVLLLTLASLALYALQIAVFRSPHDTMFYFVQDMAFLPLQVAIVTIVFKRLQNAREKKERLKKMNMAIGVFFSEAGTDIILLLIRFHTKIGEVKMHMEAIGTWDAGGFSEAARIFKNLDFAIDSRSGDLAALKELLIDRRRFLLGMLGNPNLLEHDTFTDMLWAIFHLTDEMSAREGFAGLPATDLNHISIDMKRAFAAILVEWINYMAHLKTNYPYLFSMAIRKNPFDEKADVIIR